MIIAITGASGYIGGQIALLANDAGHRVIGIDRQPCPQHLKSVYNAFVHSDFDTDLVQTELCNLMPAAIVHCAGTSLVGPSITHPMSYYGNNVAKTINLLNFVVQKLPNARFIFSSSAAVYGEPRIVPCNEHDVKIPVSPYGDSKLMIETVLQSYHTAYKLDYVAFRYFNACGADSLGRHGQEPNATHIISRVLESIINQVPFLLNGNKYPTPDGTCIRDYVHVEDIARAHLISLENRVPAGIYNLGAGKGISNLEIINMCQKITNMPVNVIVGQNRDGDPPELTASTERFEKYSKVWQLYSLRDMIQHAWLWYNKNLNTVDLTSK
jgi:UDP-glucose 4-epimerase